MADFIEDNATTNQLLRGNEHQKRVPKINYEIINRTSRFEAVYGQRRVRNLKLPSL